MKNRLQLLALALFAFTTYLNAPIDHPSTDIHQEPYLLTEQGRPGNYAHASTPSDLDREHARHVNNLNSTSDFMMNTPAHHEDPPDFDPTAKQPTVFLPNTELLVPDDPMQQNTNIKYRSVCCH